MQTTVANIFVPVVSILTFVILTNLSEKLRGEGEIILQFWGSISCGDIFLGLYINNTKNNHFFVCIPINKNISLNFDTDYLCLFEIARSCFLLNKHKSYSTLTIIPPFLNTTAWALQKILLFDRFFQAQLLKSLPLIR